MDAKADTFNRLCVKNASAEEELVIKCPSCNASLKRYEVAKHCEEEMERLRQMQIKAVTVASADIVESGECESTEDRRKPWTVFQRVQRNRQSRLKQRTRKRAAPPSEQVCPVCNASFPQDEIQRHTDQCLRRSSSNANGRDDNSSNDEEDGDEYEEYEWAGQKRIRVSSLLQGGYASIGVGQVITNHNGGQDDEEEDLNVDEDDTQIYGPAQYCENDIIPPTIEPNGIHDNEDLTSTSQTLTSSTLEPTEVRGTDRIYDVTKNCIPGVESSTSTSTTNSGHHSVGSVPNKIKHVHHYQKIIESLKAKLRHYENHVQNKFKCLICLDDYRNPAISVSCWHVHCEECWLRSLGARKLCPQCNLITTPKDLRRIYM